MTVSDVIVRATGFLHCNLNCRDLEEAAGLYVDALGMRVGMRTESTMPDASALGFATPIELDAWFLYDHRGGRRGVGLELVQWRTPPTIGLAYSDSAAIGMQSVGFVVPDLVNTRKRLVGAGARPADEALLDHDGVRIELIEDPSVVAPTFGYVRQNCRDITRSVAWYESIGFEVRGPQDQSVDGLDRQDTNVSMQRLGIVGNPSFDLRLTSSAERGSCGPAHQDANHRGLFRVALAVEDLPSAVAAGRASGRIDATEPSWAPLPEMPAGGVWASFLRDPDGVMVELVRLP